MSWHVQLWVIGKGLLTTSSKNFAIAEKEPVLKTCIFKALHLQGLTFLISFLKFVCKVKYLPTKFYHSVLPKVSSTVRKFKDETQFICWKSCYNRRFDNILSTTIFEGGSLLSTSPSNSEKIFFHGIDFLLQRRPHISIIGTLPKPT